MIKVAVVGGWHVHARDYAARARQHPDTELVAVWDDEPERGRALAAEVGAAYADDLDALLARDDVDAVTVTTATADHREVMIKIARAGKHLFTEKLLAPTVDAASEIISAADSNDVRLLVSLPRLYHGVTTAITALLAEEALGEIGYARVRLAHDGATRGWLPARFFDPDAAIGGALSDLGCHPAYLVQLFLGTHPETVSASYGSLTGQPVEDNAVVTLGYADGALGVIEASFVADSDFSIQISGSRGSLGYVEGSGLWRKGAGAGPAGWSPVALPADADDPFAQWVGHIHTGTRGEDNLARAVELTRLVVAANTAAATGTTQQYPS